MAAPQASSEIQEEVFAAHLPVFLWEIEAALKPNTVRLVGGAVRAYLLNRVDDKTDYDMATTAYPDVVMTRLEAAGIQVIPTGLKHGTVTAVKDKLNVEITTLRRDVNADGRHAEVLFTDNWETDSLRRDFTINAIYLDLDGKLHDYHNGVEDLKVRRVRFMGDPAARVQEDYLRILRYYRFAALYGTPEDMQETTHVLKPFFPALKELSGERITHELMKLLMAACPTTTLRIMQQEGVLKPLGVTLSDPGVLHHALAIWPEMPLMGRWFLVFGLQENKYFVLSKVQRKELRLYQSAHQAWQTQQWNPLQLASNTSKDAAMAVLASWGKNSEVWELSRTKLPLFPLAGRDVMDMGIAPGPQVGDFLAHLRIWWLKQNFPSREACLTQLADMINHRV